MLRTAIPFTADTYNIIDARTGFFTYAYSTSPGLAPNTENAGVRSPAAYVDANGNFLRGSQAYVLHLLPDIPAAILWSVTVYDPVTGSGLDNGQSVASLSTTDKPIQNSDGSTDIYFGPQSPGPGKNWIGTVAGKGWFTTSRRYSSFGGAYDDLRPFDRRFAAEPPDTGQSVTLCLVSSKRGRNVG
jgi:hypothetical protein